MGSNKKKSKNKNTNSSKEKNIELLNLIKHNPELTIGLCEDYWNSDVLGISYNMYSSIYTKIRPCPFDKEIIHGTNKTPKDCGCYYRCGVSYFNNTLEIKKAYLDRYSDLLSKNYYSKDKFYNLKSLAPLLTPKEEDYIATIEEQIQNELEERMNIEYGLQLKTRNEMKKNKITLHGSNKDVLPQELLDELYEIIDSNFDEIVFYQASENKIQIWDDYKYVIDKECTTSNCSISLSLYYDYLNQQNCFAFGIDDYPLEYNALESDEKLENFFYKWKDFKLFNENKYNEPYKKTLQEQDKDYINFFSNLECELCIFTNHCDGLFCLKPNEDRLTSILQDEIENSRNEEYVINLHVLEACNFKCKYCFAHFDYMKMLPINIWKHIVDNVANSMYIKRFNIAGGEPLLYPELEELIKYIKEKGFEVSIITNGFLLSEDFIRRNKNNIDCIGISVDSFDDNTLINLDCKTNKNEILDKNRFLNLCKIINECSIELKINTVISKYNWNQDMSDVLSMIDIDRWKILKMKIFKNENFDNSDLDISLEQFNYFVDNHINLIPNTIVEETLKNSYIMIDSEGCLVDNSDDKYEKLINVANESFMEGFKKLSFDKELYFSRYK